MTDLEYELNIIRENFADKQDLIIFDIGAYDCYHSSTFKAHFPHATIYAFEADERNFEKMARHSHTLNLVHMACSDVDGTVRFYPTTQFNGQSYSGSGSVCVPEVRGDSNEGKCNDGLFFDLQGIEVNSTRIDTFCKARNITHIDYLHIDVQGAEMKVMQGLGDIRPTYIFAEVCELLAYQTGITIEEFNTFMASLGYDLVDVLQFDNLYKWVRN